MIEALFYPMVEYSQINTRCIKKDLGESIMVSYINNPKQISIPVYNSEEIKLRNEIAQIESIVKNSLGINILDNFYTDIIDDKSCLFFKIKDDKSSSIELLKKEVHINELVENILDSSEKFDSVALVR